MRETPDAPLLNVAPGPRPGDGELFSNQETPFNLAQDQNTQPQEGSATTAAKDRAQTKQQSDAVQELPGVVQAPKEHAPGIIANPDGTPPVAAEAPPPAEPPAEPPVAAAAAPEPEPNKPLPEAVQKEVSADEDKGVRVESQGPTVEQRKALAGLGVDESAMSELTPESAQEIIDAPTPEMDSYVKSGATVGGVKPAKIIAAKNPQAKEITPQALGVTHGGTRALKDAIAGVFGTVKENVPAWIKELRGLMRGTAGQTFPKTTLENREAGEAAARWISARQASLPLARVFSVQVLEGTGIDPRMFGAALTEDNLRSVRNGHAEAGDKDKANAVVSIIGGKGSPFKTEEDYQAFLQDLVVQQALARHKSLWSETVDPMYKQAMMIDQSETLPDRGAQTGARINLFADPQAKGPKASGSPQGNLLGTLRKKSPFGIQAKGTGDYSINYHDIMANTFGRQMEIAAKNEFETLLVESGNAVIGKPGQAATMTLADGEGVREFPLKRMMIMQQGQGAIPANQSIYVRENLAREYQRGANIERFPVPTAMKYITGKLNNTALAGLTDATVHVTNLGTVLMTRPGSIGNAWIDSALSATGRADIPIRLTQAIIKGMQNNASQIAELTRIGAMRDHQEHQPKTTIAGKVLAAPRNAMGDLIHWADQTTRLVMDDAYKSFVKQGIVADNETNRREWVNQVGQYNKRAQGDLIRLARDTGLGPFATAGRTFIALGVKNVTMDPGVRGANATGEAALRLNVAAKWLGAFAFVAAGNAIVTGQMSGRPGTPIGSIDTGKDDENGRPLSVNVFNLMGYARALRVTGIKGYVESKRKGLGGAEARDAAVRDVINANISPFAGPPVKFASGLAGLATAVSVHGSPKAAPGESQFWLNAKYAASEANPIIGSIVDATKPGGTWKDAMHRQLPRFTLSPTQPADMMQNYPAIVRKARATEFISDVISQARYMSPESRQEFVAASLQRLHDPADKIKAVKEFRYRLLRVGGAKSPAPANPNQPAVALPEIPMIRL